MNAFGAAMLASTFVNTMQFDDYDYTDVFLSLKDLWLGPASIFIKYSKCHVLVDGTFEQMNM